MTPANEEPSTVRTGSRLKRILANCALIGASLLVGVIVILAAGEAYLRMAFDADRTGPLSDWYNFHEVRGWTLEPGDYAFLHVDAFRSVAVSINAMGLRGAPVAPQVPPGKSRVTLLGDSFLFAEALNDGESLTGRLAALGGDNLEVVNAGIPGFGTGQQILLLQDLAAAGFDVGDKIVLMFFTNDLQDNVGLSYSSLERDKTKPAFFLDDGGHLQVDPPQRSTDADSHPSALDRSLFFKFLRFNAEVVLAANPWVLDRLGITPPLPRTPGIIAGWYGPAWRDHWRITEDVLDYGLDWLQQQGRSQAYLVFMPSPFQVQELFTQIVRNQADTDPRFQSFLDDMDRPQRVLRAFATDRGLPYLDLTPLLREASRDGLMFFPREGHLNPDGAERVAQAIFGFLNEAP